MAGNIKGITIEIGGETTGLQKAIKGVTSESIDLQQELKTVDKLLKFNPGNAELVAQKQEILSKQIEKTSEKLNVLKQAQSQVDAQFAAGKINDEQYRAFNREIINTESSLNSLKNQLNNTAQAQQEMESKSRQLDALLKATGLSVDQLSNTLGTGLTNAIKNGTASSKQLDVALDKIGKAALGSSADIDKMKKALKSADDGASLKEIQKDLSKVAKEAKEAGDEVNSFGDDLGNVIGGLAAGGGIAGAVSAALDVSSLKTKIDISFNVSEESKQSVKDAIKGIEAYGIDAESALEGVRRQWLLNKDASDETNAAVVEMAGTISTKIPSIDFTELIQEGNEIAATLGITNEEAMGFVNTLLDVGFPPEQLDIIAEYGDQMIQAGFSAKEVQAIMAAGVDTKTWNIDNLLDGVKEGRIQMADFGNGLNKEMKGLIGQTNISADKFVGWGQAIAKGGEGGQKAMLEATKALAGVKDETVRNQLGTKMFGTMWEDQGKKIISTILNSKNKTVDLKKGIEDVNKATEKIDNDPTVQMRKAFTDLKEALSPLLEIIAKVVSGIASWVKENPALAAAITAIVSAIGILVGIMVVLAPIFTAISTAAGVLGVTMGTVALPILGIVAAISAVIAIGVLLYKNWDSISAYASTVWGGIKEFLSNTWNSIKEIAISVWNGISSFLSGLWNGIKVVASAIWDGIKTYFTTVLNIYKTLFTTAWNGIKSVTSSVFNGIKSLITTIWNGIKTTFTTVLNGIKSVVTSVWNGIKSTVSSVMNAIGSIISKVWNTAKTVVTNAVNGIKSIVTSIFNGLKNVVSTAMNSVKSAIETGWNKSKSFLSGISLTSIGKDIINGLVSGINSMFGKVKSKISELSKLIPDWAKDVLGIKSPSRVMADQVGQWIPAGVADGINANLGLVKSATDNMANAAMPDISKNITITKEELSKFNNVIASVNKQNAKEINEIHNKANNDRAAITKEANKKIDDIEQKAREKKRKLTSDEIRKIRDIEEKAAIARTKIAEKEKKDVAAVNKSADAEKLKALQDYVEKRKASGTMTLEQEIAFWKQANIVFKNGSNEQLKVQKELNSAKADINKQAQQINEDYLNKVKDLNQKLIDEEKRLNEEYQKALDDRTKSLYSFAGIFDEVTQKDISGDTLLSNLQGQVVAFEDWQRNISELASKGINEGLLAELQEMGPKAGAEIAALNSLTDEQLQQYVALWQEKNRLAKEQATKELEGMKLETGQKIEELRLDTASKLLGYQEEWRLAMANAKIKVKNEAKEMPNIGGFAVSGLISGMNSKKGALISAAQELASVVRDTFQNALDIHSPSRVFKGYGININEGLIQGIEQSSRQLQRVMDNVYGSMANSSGKLMQSSTNNTYRTQTNDNSKNMTNHITISTSGNNNRDFERVMRRLAFEF